MSISSFTIDSLRDYNSGLIKGTMLRAGSETITSSLITEGIFPMAVLKELRRKIEVRGVSYDFT